MTPVLICSFESLSDPGTKSFELPLPDGESIAGFVVRRGEQVYAYRDSCPHTGVPLAWMPDRYFDLEHIYLQCSLHGALFIPESGLCVRGPCIGASLTPLRIERRADNIYVSIGTEAQGAGLG